jgi:PAS domain S-box-containing protein
VPVLAVGEDDGRIRAASDRALELLGYDQDELIGLEAEDLHPHELDAFRVHREQIETNQFAWNDDLSCRHRSGRLIPAEVLSLKVASEEGRPAGLHVLWEQAPSEKQVAESEEQFRTLLDQTRTGVFIQKDGRFQYVNPRFTELTGSNDRVAIRRSGIPAERVTPTPAQPTTCRTSPAAKFKVLQTFKYPAQLHFTMTCQTSPADKLKTRHSTQ